jgi:ankyrin repeat protein
LETLWIWAKEAELNPHELLLAQNEEGNTAWQVAAGRCHLELLKKMWVWANEVQQNSNELKKKLLLNKDKYGYTAWHDAAIFGRLEALETLWRCAKEVELSPDEILLPQNEQGRNILHIASEKKTM